MKALPQPMQPHGFSGRIFGWLMERINRPAYLSRTADETAQAIAWLERVGFAPVAPDGKTGSSAIVVAHRAD